MRSACGGRILSDLPTGSNRCPASPQRIYLPSSLHDCSSFRSSAILLLRLRLLPGKRLDETWTMPGSAPAEHVPPQPAREPLPTAAPPASPPAPEASPDQACRNRHGSTCREPCPGPSATAWTFSAFGRRRCCVGLRWPLPDVVASKQQPGGSGPFAAALEENVRTSTTPSKVLPELIGLVNASAGTSFSTADQERLARAAITLSRRLEKVAIERRTTSAPTRPARRHQLAEKAAKRSGSANSNTRS